MLLLCVTKVGENFSGVCLSAARLYYVKQPCARAAKPDHFKTGGYGPVITLVDHSEQQTSTFYYLRGELSRCLCIILRCALDRKVGLVFSYKLVKARSSWSKPILSYGCLA